MSIDNSDKREALKGKTNKSDSQKRFNLNTLISILAILLALFSYFKSCGRQNQINLINFQKMAEDYRPELIVSNPFDLTISVKLDTEAMRLFVKAEKQLPSSPSFMIPLSEMKFKFSVWVHNRGNAQANLLLTAFGDSVYDGPMIEKEILKGINVHQISFKADEGFANIDEGDSLRINSELSIKNMLRNKVWIHLFLLYENDNRFLYSSYTWFNFKVYPEKMLIMDSDSMTIIGIKNRMILSPDQFSYEGRYTNMSVVEPKDTSVFRNLIRSMKKEILDNKKF